MLGQQWNTWCEHLVWICENRRYKRIWAPPRDCLWHRSEEGFGGIASDDTSLCRIVMVCGCGRIIGTALPKLAIPTRTEAGEENNKLVQSLDSGCLFMKRLAIKYKVRIRQSELDCMSEPSRIQPQDFRQLSGRKQMLSDAIRGTDRSCFWSLECRRGAKTNGYEEKQSCTEIGRSRDQSYLTP